MPSFYVGSERAFLSVQQALYRLNQLTSSQAKLSQRRHLLHKTKEMRHADEITDFHSKELLAGVGGRKSGPTTKIPSVPNRSGVPPGRQAFLEAG